MENLSHIPGIIILFFTLSGILIGLKYFQETLLESNLLAPNINLDENHRRLRINFDPKTVTPRLPNNVVSIQQCPEICEGKPQTSKDAIVMLVQKKHSTYDVGHSVDILGPLAALLKSYPDVVHADVLLWHEGDFTLADIPVHDLKPLNIRLCNFNCTRGIWGPPGGFTPPPMFWSVGYRNMIRFYAVTIWQVLTYLGYEYVLRLDDDSNFMSHIPYNLFDALRYKGAIYGFRQGANECGSKRFGPFVDSYVAKKNIMPKHGPITGNYCSSLARDGYYNNFFVSQLAWWQEQHVAEFVQAFDESKLIYTDRDNDLIFQTAVVKLFAEKSQVLKYVDWSHAHVTVSGGQWTYGGASIGTEVPNPEDQIQYFQSWMAERYNVAVQLNSNLFGKCNVINHLCQFQNCDKCQLTGVYGHYCNETLTLTSGRGRHVAPTCHQEE